MLDWLSNTQQASAAEASQILDAPQTPAPLFAYRALRSVLFGSHEGEESDENDKENIPLEETSGKVSTQLQDIPLKPKSSTPQRHTPRRLLSPAKSILRTPGLVPTPRRQSVSVKFKDTKRTSLELRTVSKGSVIEEEPVSLQAKLAPIGPSEPAASTESVTEMSEELQMGDTNSLPETYYNVKEINAYIAATEREMKKLVRYGQRMREYARLSQKENVTLRRELDKVKEENEALQLRQHSSISREKAGEDGDNAGLFDLSPSSTYQRKAPARKRTDDERKVTENAMAEKGQKQPDRGTVEKIHETKNLSKSSQSKIDDSPAPSKEGTMAPLYQPSTQSPRAAIRLRVASRTQLAPDRLAAAKARLRVKSEERKKALSMAGRMEKEDHGSSGVDWQDL